MRHLGQEQHLPPDTSERASLSRFAQLAPRMLSSHPDRHEGERTPPSAGWLAEVCLARATARLTPACPKRQTPKSLAGSPHTSRAKNRAFPHTSPAWTRVQLRTSASNPHRTLPSSEH